MLIDALNRTLLLMGTALNLDCTLETRLEALTKTRVAISADAAALRTVSGQSALVTMATLMARSGHEIWIAAEETLILSPQPPLRGPNLLAGLVEAGLDLLPDCEIRRGAPQGRVDLAVLIGAPRWAGEAGQVIAMNAGDAWATLGGDAQPWAGDDQPLGGMATGALAAAEAFKSAMRRLRAYAPSPLHFDGDFAPAEPCKVVLAPDGRGYTGKLPPADLISGGAIGNAVAFVLLRMPGVEGRLGVLDNDRSDLTNLNRNALLRRSQTGGLKVDDLAGYATGAVALEPRPIRFEPGTPLAAEVLIGVDDIASRWAAQATDPQWLGVGATAGFSVQVSEHRPGDACAGCLHPVAAQAAGPIPTVAFVSFWAGLLLVARWLRNLAGGEALAAQTFFSPLRPEGWAYADLGVAANPACPVACIASAGLQQRA